MTTKEHARRARCRSLLRGEEQNGRDLISRIDHAVWQVGNLEQCVEVFAGRLGFPLLRSCTDTTDLRFVELDFGGLPVRLVENRLGSEVAAMANLMVVAFESRRPLTEATNVLRQRGFTAGQIHTAISERPDIANFRFSLIRGIAQLDQASLTAAVVLTEFLEPSGLRTKFVDSTIHHAGIAGIDSITAEVEDEAGLLRWQKFFGNEGPVSQQASGFLIDPSLRVVAGSRDGFSSMAIGCYDLLRSARNFETCGVSGYCCRGEILLDPSETGGLALRLVDCNRA